MASRRFNHAGRSPTIYRDPEAAQEALDWVQDTLDVLQWIEEFLSETINAWDHFSSVGGDINYLADMDTSIEAPAHLSLRVANDLFEELGELLRLVRSSEKTCRRMADNVRFEANIMLSMLIHSRSASTWFEPPQYPIESR